MEKEKVIKTTISLPESIHWRFQKAAVEKRMGNKQAVESALSSWSDRVLLGSTDTLISAGESAVIANQKERANIDLTSLTKDQIALVEAFADILRLPGEKVHSQVVTAVTGWKEFMDARGAQEATTQGSGHQQVKRG